MNKNSHVALWDDCLKIIQDNVSESTFKTWFEPIVPLKYSDKTLLIQVPSQFFYEFLEEKFVDLLRQTLYKVIGEGTKLMYNVMVDKGSKHTVNLEGTTRSTSINQQDGTQIDNKSPRFIHTPKARELNPQLNPSYNFESFIEGDSNKLARSVADAVAENPAKTVFNPLFIHGNSGVGKTHLVNAIGTKIKERFPEKRVLYVSAHLFKVQYTDSVRNNTTNDFINFYQTIDVLIIDDIQEFAGVTKTQNTFFHIFNHLHQNGKQLVLTSDRSPVLLQGMNERLLTRFKWGMVAELYNPSVELRRSILKNKINRDGLSFPKEVIDYIAENVNDSIRDLEGIIISMMAHSTIYNKEIDLTLAKRIVSKVAKVEDKVITIDQIIEIVSKYFNIDISAIHSRSRKREIASARQMAMYLAKTYTESSTTNIGRCIGNRNHATVLHACKVVQEQCEVDKVLRADFEALQREIKSK